MTFAGKKHKAIYDSGAEELISLENGASARLKETASEHANTRKNGEDGSVARVEDRAKELEAELKAFMTKSIERLQKVMEVELKETSEHLDSVKFDLSSQSEKLKGSILDLRHSYEENIEHLCAGLSDDYEGAIESNTIDLEKQDYSSTKHIRSHGTVVLNSLQQKLDHSLWESRGEEKQYNSLLFKTFMQKANSIDTHFSSLMGKLSSDFAAQFKVLETRAQQAEPDLASASQALLSTIDTMSHQYETSIADYFRSVLEEHNKNLDTNLSNIAQDLSSVHDSTTERLSGQTRQLGASLVTASGEAREALTEKCKNLRQQVDTMLESFTERMDEKLEASNLFAKTLEAEKTEIFGDIRKELSEIKETFEERLTELMNEAVSRVQEVSGEAEKEIISAHKRCDDNINTDGAAAKAEIDQAIAEFINLLSEHRKKALEQIAKSAGATPEPDKPSEGTSKPAEPRPGRRVRKREDSPTDPEV